MSIMALSQVYTYIMGTGMIHVHNGLGDVRMDNRIIGLYRRSFRPPQPQARYVPPPRHGYLGRSAATCALASPRGVPSAHRTYMYIMGTRMIHVLHVHVERAHVPLAGVHVHNGILGCRGVPRHPSAWLLGQYILL